MVSMAKIVIDARESGSSTGRYIDKLIESLHALQPDERITIVTKPHRLEYFRRLAPDFTLIETSYKEFTFGEQGGFRRQLAGLEADLVHFGMVQQPVLYQGKVVTTIHDLTTTRFVNPDKKRTIYLAKQQVYKFVIKQAARKSAAIITPSQYVKADVVDFTGVPADKVTVTYESADPIPDPPTPLPGLQNKKFIIYVGRPTPHKNLPRLIEAFALLRSHHPDLRLVLAGKKDANYQAIENGLASSLRSHVYFTDFVSEGQLRWLYEHCAAYVFPSLSEGFGLPGLEAMLHGAPVVSSDATCLPEIYGQAAHYFDPLDSRGMADAIDEVLTTKGLRADLIKAGEARAGAYSWKRMAEQTLAIYTSVLAGKR
jgi:glycosyltransferase involved in cell wall biosynthesis